MEGVIQKRGLPVRIDEGSVVILPHVRLSSARLKVILASVLLSLVGAAVPVAFRAYGYEETHWVLFLIALAIGTAANAIVPPAKSNPVTHRSPATTNSGRSSPSIGTR